jgi:hypothetical protein
VEFNADYIGSDIEEYNDGITSTGADGAWPPCRRGSFAGVGPTVGEREDTMGNERWMKASVGLGVLALIAVASNQLALTDIYHGEADVSLEWNVLRVGFAVIVVSQVTSLVTLTRMLRNGQRAHTT